MFQVGDYIVYKNDVCIVKEIKYNKRFNSECYILAPISDESLIISVSIDDKLNVLRKLLTKEEALKLIDDIPNIKPLDPINDKMIEHEYKASLKQGHIGLIKIIKTAYLRNDKRIKNNKKTGEKDNQYFKKAEMLLYNELSIALDMTIEETKRFIAQKVDSK